MLHILIAFLTKALFHPPQINIYSDTLNDLHSNVLDIQFSESEKLSLDGFYASLLSRSH